MPEPVRGSSSVLVPKVDYSGRNDRGADIMCQVFGCERHHLPDGEGWGEERITINSHIGTHVDAPLPRSTTRAATSTRV